MANIVKLKKSAVPGKEPLSTDLVYGELALNYADGKLFYKSTDDSIQSISGGGGTGGTFTFDTAPPTDPAPAVGDTWIDSGSGIEYRYVNDGDTLQWVELGLSVAPGIEVGGTTGQVLAKASDDDYDTEWVTVDALPLQTGNDGKYLTTDGSIASWATVDALPSQTGNDGKYLTTDGSIASWATLSSSFTLGSTSISLGGTATSIAGLTELVVDNLNINGNTISSTDSNGNITISPQGTGVVAVSDSRITGVALPINDTDAANKQYVDNAIQGLHWKAAINLYADSNVALTGATGTLVIDSHAALDVADDGIYRILLTNQSTDSENGIYLYTDDGDNYTLVRATDSDVYSELVGASVYVLEGTTYLNTGWVQTNHYLTDFTGQTWIQFSGAADTGIKFTYDSTPPAMPTPGDIWLNSDTGVESTYINDGDTSLWLETGLSVSSGILSGGATGEILAKVSGDNYDTAWTDVNTLVTKSFSILGRSASTTISLTGSSYLPIYGRSVNTNVPFQL